MGVKGTPKVDHGEGRLTTEAEGLRISLAGAVLETEGETLRVRIPPLK